MTDELGFGQGRDVLTIIQRRPLPARQVAATPPAPADDFVEDWTPIDIEQARAIVAQMNAEWEADNPKPKPKPRTRKKKDA